MAGMHHGPDEEDEAASRYLRSIQGSDNEPTPPAGPPVARRHARPPSDDPPPEPASGESLGLVGLPIARRSFRPPSDDTDPEEAPPPAGLPLAPTSTPAVVDDPSPASSEPTSLEDAPSRKRGLRQSRESRAGSDSTRFIPESHPVDRSALASGPALSVASHNIVPGVSSLGMPFAILPPSFESEGLVKLRAGDYRGSERYYATVVKQDAMSAAGWFGLGAARQGRGRIRAAVSCYVRALALDTDKFPLAALVIEARPGRPEIHFQVSMALAGHKTIRTTRVAIALLDEVMASPMTPTGLYSKTEATARRLRKDLEWLEAQGDQELLSIKKAAAWENKRHVITRGILVVVTLVVVAVGAFLAFQRSHSTALHDEGFELYKEAYRVEKRDANSVGRTGGNDAYTIYQEALARFVESARLYPENVPAQYMIARAAEGVLRQIPCHFGVQNAPKGMAAALRVRIQKAEAACRKADPRGKETARVKSYVDDAHHRIH